MNLDTETIERIERYVEGRLAADELARFEARMRADAAFQKEVAVYVDLMKGLRAEGHAAWFRKTAEWERTYQKGEDGIPLELDADAKKTGNRRWFGSVAAVILLLILPLGYWLTRPPSSEALYVEYFEPYPNLISARGEENALEAGMAAYEAGKYEAADSLLEEALAAGADKKAYLYVGIARMELENFEGALAALNEAKGNELVEEQAQWYEVLLYVKWENMEQAKELLKEMKGQEGHAYREKAKLLWGEL